MNVIKPFCSGAPVVRLSNFHLIDASVAIRTKLCAMVVLSVRLW